MPKIIWIVVAPAYVARGEQKIKQPLLLEYFYAIQCRQ